MAPRRWRSTAVLCAAAMVGSVLVGTDASAAAPLAAQAATDDSVVGGLSDLEDAAVNGSLLAPGTYEINSTLELGAGQELAAEQPGQTTIRFTGNRGSVIDVTGTDVTISGITITGGSNSNGSGGGIDVGRNATLTLIESTVTGNTAREGGGINNDGTLVVERSTFDNNTAGRKGGGLRDNGTSTITNSTFVANAASQGGAISTSGSTRITHATIVRNQSTSSSSAGVDRNGGTVEVLYSIIGANTRDNGSAASDCSGTPDLIGLNLVTDDSGCNPVGPILVAENGDVGPLNIGPLGDNGGPTETVALLDGSAALDAVALTSTEGCPAGLSVDQRGTDRPFDDSSVDGPGCDLGAYERSELSIDVTLGADTTNYPGLDDGTVEVGLRTVAVEGILDEIVTPTSGSIEDAALRSIALRSIALRSITVEDIALRSIEPKATALRSIALRSIALRSIALRSIALRSIALRSIALRSIPLSEIPLTEGVPTSDEAPGDPLVWEELLAGTIFEGVPLQSITLEDLVEADVNLDGLSLESIDLSSTALRSIALRSILLQDAALRSIPVDGYEADTDGGYAGAWCTILGDLCGDGDEQLSPEEIGDADLVTIQLAGGNVDDVPVYDVPLSGLASTALRSIALRSIALRSIYIENTALRSIALRSIALRSIDALESLVDCENYPEYCDVDESNTFTLGDVPEAALIGTVGDLVDLPADLIDDFSFGDLLLAFAAPEVSPWEQLDLEDLRLQNIGEPAQPTFDYVATVEVRESTADLDVTLTLPPGFAIATRDDDAPITFDGVALTRSNDDLGAATFEIPGVAPGTYDLRVPVRAGIVTGGPFTAAVAVDATSGATVKSAVATTDVDVVQAGDTGGSTTVATLNFDDLTLAHVSSNDDADLYEFTPTASQAGSAARILLSNIPADVDYDLAVYEPSTTPLREGAAPERLSSVRETRYDLNPLDDVYPTDEVDDVATDVPAQFGISDYVPRDLSSRRSNADEEVRIPNLQEGTTYYVAVTSYLGASSNQPYGLRLRVDDTDRLPECLATDRSFANDLPSDPLTVGPVPTNANTLYITNTQWLAGEVGASTARNIIAAAEATTGTNGVVAGVVALDADADVSAAYADWALAENRCSPDARNAVARAIGTVLDGLVDDDVENIVILGGDGVVPMAAVPDRTAYSNETTFARNVLSDGASNEVAGTLGAGYLLSDDPYATEAGIEVNSGDHELYVPTRAIGRLVEDGAQILTQLENFVTYGGRLDPATLPGLGQATAAVTGYDFLTDGADAVADALAAGIEGVDSSLNNETWDRDAYLALFATGGADVISPNAHYDFESLLPAANDGTFFEQSDLATTADFTGDNDFRLPDRSVIFSMGCHAGLSVSDVQLGITALDWAELYADGDNPWLAHTTYGYGDTEIVAYSEKLAELFAEQLVLRGDGSGSLGDAIRVAKQDYLASTLVLSPYDEKILQSFTYYGLPMYSVGGPELVQPFGGARVAQASEATVAESPVTFGPTIAGEGSDPDRTPVTIDVPVGSTSGPRNLHLVETEEGSYYEVGGNTVTAQYRPVQPLIDAPIDPAVGPTAGLLITGLTSQDIEPFAPRYLRPTVDLDDNERRIEPADGSFPATLQRVATGGSGEQRLLVAAGQYEENIDDPGTGLGRQRLFTNIRGELYEAGPTSDGVGPSFSRITGNIGEDDGVIFFEVETVDEARRVVVVYREGDSEQWLPLDLFRSTSTGNTWVGGFRPNTLDPVEFFVQAVATDGDIGISSNKVENFFTTAPVEEGNLEIVLQIVEPTVEVAGYYTGPVTFEIISPSGTDGIRYSVDAQPFEDYDPASAPVVSGDGGHVVFARDNTGSQQFLYFVIDGSAPALRAERSPDVGDDTWANGPIDVLLSAVDVGQSGVERIEYSASGANVIEPTSILGDQGTVRLEQNGITTVTATAFDVAGNASTPVTVEVRIDTEAPTVTATADPASDGFVNSAVAVTLDASDGDPELSGIDRIDYTIDDGTGPTSPITYTEGQPIDLTDDGTYTIVATAYDNAGNPSDPTTIVVRVDTDAPTLTSAVDSAEPGNNGWQRATATVTLTAADGGSGIATTTYRIDGNEELPYDGPFTLGDGVYTISATTSDNAGNTTTIDFDVEVDTTAPTLPTPTVPADYVNTAVNVNLAPNDDGSGIARVDYTINGVAATTTGPFDLTVTADGITTVTATAFDVAGNASTAVTVEIKIDTTGPVVSIDAPSPTPTSNGFVAGPATVTLSAVDAGVGSVDRIDYTINDDVSATYDGPIELGDGSYTVVAIAYDTLGNAGAPQTLVLDVDATAPLIDAEVPLLASVGDDITLSYVCSDPQPGSGLATTDPVGPGCDVLVDGAPPSNDPAFDTTTQRWELLLPAGAEPGSTTIALTATDNVGNTTTMTADVRVAWQTCLLYDPTQEKNAGSNFTIKVQLCDQDGNNVSSRQTKLTALTVDGTDDPGPTFSGKSNDGYEFRFTRSDSAYTYNLDTNGLEPGPHVLFFTTEPIPRECTLPVPDNPVEGCSLADLQALATNSAEFRLK